MSLMATLKLPLICAKHAFHYPKNQISQIFIYCHTGVWINQGAKNESKMENFESDLTYSIFDVDSRKNNKNVVSVIFDP